MKGQKKKEAAETAPIFLRSKYEPVDFLRCFRTYCRPRGRLGDAFLPSDVIVLTLF
jgi:hypothetical protein